MELGEVSVIPEALIWVTAKSCNILYIMLTILADCHRNIVGSSYKDMACSNLDSYKTLTFEAEYFRVSQFGTK